MDDCERKIPCLYASPNLRKAEGCGAFAPIQDELRRHRLTKSGGIDIVVCKSVAKIKLSEPRTHNIDFW